MDLATMTNEELIENVAAHLPQHSDYSPLLDEIVRRLNADVEEIFVLPVSITEAIRSHWGGGARTFAAMTKRVRFAYKVWQGKYGPWTPEQAEYAEELCLFAINQASKAIEPSHSRPLVYTWLDRIVNHEATHEGFLRRQAAQVPINLDLGV